MEMELLSMAKMHHKGILVNHTNPRHREGWFRLSFDIKKIEMACLKFDFEISMIVYKHIHLLMFTSCRVEVHQEVSDKIR